MSESTIPASSETAPRARRHAHGFWVVAYLFAVTMAAAGAPTPLYVLYQRRDGFGSFTITVIFAVYALGVVVSLFLAGHLSDRFGRRRVIAPAVLLNILAILIFLSWTALPGLLIARFVSGLGIGMLTATATAHLTELHQVSRPGQGNRRAEVVSTAVNMGGIGLGPLIAGVLAQYAPRPLDTGFMVFAFLLTLGLLAVVTVPETVVGVDAAWRYRPQRVAVPAEARGAYLGAAMAGFVGFALFGFFSALVPSFLSGRLGISSHAVAGLVSFIAFGACALFQIVTSRWGRPTQYLVGVVVLAAGILLVTTGIAAVMLPVLLVGGFIAGGGVGVLFKAAVGTVVAVAVPGSRGEALAGLFLVSYVGMAVPVVLLGLLLQFAAMLPAVLAFGGLLLALLAATVVVLARVGALASVR